MKKQNLSNLKFGRLTVVSEGKTIISKTNKKYTTWICVCECGKKILAKTIDLTRGGTKSCGCLREHLRLKIKPKQIFGRLVTEKYLGSSLWECKCVCGTIKNIKSNRLISGKTKSCGCLKKEINKKNINIAINKRRKFKPEIASARRIWQNYCYADGVTSKSPLLTFEEFYKKSQMPCYYCGILPSNKFNLFKYAHNKGSNYSISNGTFIYNILDKLNNNKPYINDNCVSCCLLCSRAKNKKSVEEFYKFIQKLNIKNNLHYHINDDVNLNKLHDKRFKNLVKFIYKSNYNDGDLSIEDFFYLSQMTCHFCNSKSSNCIQRGKNKIYKFNYNLLNRIDYTMPHNKNNVVPCCKSCNFIKRNLSMNEFYSWIHRIKTYKK
jgi:hypothetical protein